MADNETPQPITRAEFEAGLKFKVESTSGTFYLERLSNTSNCITDHHDEYVCSSRDITEKGFTACSTLLGQFIEVEILFENLFKSPNQ